MEAVYAALLFLLRYIEAEKSRLTTKQTEYKLKIMSLGVVALPCPQRHSTIPVDRSRNAKVFARVLCFIVLVGVARHRSRSLNIINKKALVL